MIHSSFAKKLAERRRAAGISQQMLAEMMEVTAKTVSRWERGLALPSTENLFRLGQHFPGIGEDLLSAGSEFIRGAANGMESLTELYRIGRGPSSSHTIGPERACKQFLKEYPEADRLTVTLYESLAKTGKGHGTDTVIERTFSPLPVKILWDTATPVPHPNTLDITAYRGETLLGKRRIFSIGGGRIAAENETVTDAPLVYGMTQFHDIAAYCRKKRIRLWQYVEETEGEQIWDYLSTIWETMQSAIDEGLNAEGILPGGLNVHRKARYLHEMQHVDETAETRENRLVCSYAFAVSEQNAAGGTIATAPTCGAAGVLPAVLYYQRDKHRFTDRQILEALATAGLIGNLIKTNASISGAECGCQAEVGTACAMAAAALAELFRLSLDKIEYAAEIAIEHHLGLTCDPICGLVQIPCIERNAVAAMRAINAVNLSSFLSETRKISLDNVITIMKQTGRDMSRRYKETSEAGLANLHPDTFHKGGGRI